MTPLIKVKLLQPDARLPEYQTIGDTGADVRWYEADLQEYALKPGETRKFPLGIAIQPAAGYATELRPRSGLSSRGVLGHFGTCDHGYVGELSAVLTNLSSWPVTFNRGDRIAQLVVVPVAIGAFRNVDKLATTVRGDAGFGSSGVK